MIKKTQKISITTEYITLGQFLKISGLILTGGEAKQYLASTLVRVNTEVENRRGRKLREGDKVEIEDTVYEIVRK